MKKPWKDMEFTEEELRRIEQSGRIPRSPDAHQPDLGPRGWLAPPPPDQLEKKSRRRRFEDLDETVDAAFSAVRDKPAGLVQWLDANVLVTDHGAGDPVSSGPVGAGGPSPNAPAPPTDHDALDDIPLEVDLDEASSQAATSGAPALVEEPGESIQGKPSAVDAVFRALAGGPGQEEHSAGSDGDAVSAGDATDEAAGDSLGTQTAEVALDMSQEEETDSGTYEIEDTVSDVAAPDEESSSLSGPAPIPGRGETIRMPVTPGRSDETVRMVPPPPPPPPPAPAASVSIADEAGQAAAVGGGNLEQDEGRSSLGGEHLELDVELDSLGGLEDQESGVAGGRAPAPQGADPLAGEPGGSLSEGPALQTQTPTATMDAPALDRATADPAPETTLPPPVPGDKAPPPLPQGDKAAPPPVPAGPTPSLAGAGDAVTSPPPVPALDKTAPAPAVPAAKESAATGGQGDVSSARPPKPRDFARKKPWYQDFFDDDYLPTLPHETPESTLKEVEFLLSELSLPEDGLVLDLGCGYGRHAVEFAARGFSVVGLDNSLPMLIKAAQYCQLKGVDVEFVQEDMREMNFDGKFDALYCFGTTFGYFGDDENRDILKRMNQALKPDGRLVLEVVNRDYLLADLPLRVWWEGEGCLVMDEVDFNYFTSRVEAHRTVVFNEGRQIERNMSIRVYSLHELGSQLFQAGFRVLKITGHLATRGRFFGMYSPHLIVTATKKG